MSTSRASKAHAVRHEPVPTKQTPERRKTSWLVLSLGFFWAALILIAAYLATVEASSSELAQIEIDKLQSLNLPTDNESLDQWLRDRTSTDGTAVWQEIYLTVKHLPSHIAMDSTREDEESFSEVADEVRIARQADLGHYVDQMKPVIERIHNATADATPTYFPVVFDGFDTKLAPLQQARSVSRLLVLELEEAVHEADHDRALRALISLQGIAKITDWSLAVIGELIHAALVNSHLDAMESTLAFDFWTESELDLLLRQIDEPMEIKQRWRSTVASERAMALMSAESKSRQGLISTPSALLFLPRFPLNYLEFARSWETLGDDGLESLVSKSKSLETKISPTKLDVMTQMLLPSIQVMAEQYVRLENRRRLTIAALGVKKFQVRNGRWPTQLGDIATVGVSPDNFQSVARVPFDFEVSKSRRQTDIHVSIANDGQAPVPKQTLGVTVSDEQIFNQLKEADTVDEP